MPDFEITIVGAGVVGLATAARLAQKHPGLLVLERNQKYGMETSSRNSEVIHAGIYYTPGSLKAQLCVEGRDELYKLCEKHSIPHRRITKLISACTKEDLSRLEGVFRNGLKNGVSLEMLDRQATLKLEPNIRTEGAIFSPSTGIVSAHHLMDHFYQTATEKGATVQHRCELVGIDPTQGGYQLSVKEGSSISTITSATVINAAGLGCDTVAAMAGIDVDSAGYRLTLAKGSYFSVVGPKARLVTRLVYPAPTNESLGVHALLDLGGRLRFGPDVEYLSSRTLDYAVAESKRSAFAESIRRILPSVSDEDIAPDMCGIRPKLQRKGEQVKDFVIAHERNRGLEGFVNLIGIESPGLTASPAIARMVENMLFG